MPGYAPTPTYLFNEVPNLEIKWALPSHSLAIRYTDTVKYNIMPIIFLKDRKQK